MNNNKTVTFTICVTIYPSDFDDLGETIGYRANQKEMQRYLDNEMRLTMEGMRAAAIDMRRGQVGKSYKYLVD